MLTTKLNEMKNIKAYLAAGLLLVILSGCTERFIDIERKDRLSIDLAWSTLDGLEGSILGVYERGRTYLESNDLSLYQCAATDLVKPGTHLTDQAVVNQYSTFQGFDQYSSGPLWIWEQYNTGLHRCNVIIQNIDNVEINPDSPGDLKRKQTVLGEAYFFRAYFHLMLIQRYGKTVMHDRLFEDPLAKYHWAPKDSVYNLIEGDLIQAIDLLPGPESLSKGRVNQATAKHLLSKAYMDMELYGDAAEMAESVINDYNYSLIQDSLHHVFSIYHQENEEVIFSWQFSNLDRTRPQRITHQWYPLYDRINGVLRTMDDGGRPWARLVASDYCVNELYDDKSDLRLKYWYKLAWVYTDTANMPAGVSLGDTVKIGDGHTSANDPVRDIDPTTDKYAEDGSLGKTTEDAEGFRNIIVYRLSEAYLIAAEAHLLNNNAAAGQSYFDAIRERAGVASIPLNLENLIDEQARELAHEGHRWVFLNRHGILVERVKEHVPEVGNNMSDYNKYWPIPQSFCDQTGLDNNEGYE